MKGHVVLAIGALAVPVVAVLAANVAVAAPGLPGPLPLATRTVTEVTSFTSPSGNIGCYIEPGRARCDIRERNWTPPPKAASCPDFMGWGQGLELSTGEPAGVVCAGDTALTNGNPLAYGDTIVGGSIECTSLPSGMSCWDTQYGGEFTLSRQGYQLS